MAAAPAALAAALAIVQVRYLVQPPDLAYHLQHTGAILAWAVACWALQRLLNRPRWAEAARHLWAVTDPILFTLILYFALPPIGPLLVGYAVMIAVSGLLLRVRLVATTTVASLLSYGGLLIAYPVEAALPHYCLIFAVLLAVLGFITSFQVRRIRVLSRYYEGG